MVLAFVAVLLGAQVASCHTEKPSHSETAVQVTAVLLSDSGVAGHTHGPDCGHHLAAGLEMVRGWTTRGFTGGLDLLTIGAFAAAGIVLTASQGGFLDRWRQRRRRACPSELRFGRLLLLDMSVAQI